MDDEDETLSEGGIVAISSTLGDLLDLRRRQAENGSIPVKDENAQFVKKVFLNYLERFKLLLQMEYIFLELQS